MWFFGFLTSDRPIVLNDILKIYRSYMYYVARDCDNGEVLTKVLFLAFLLICVSFIDSGFNEQNKKCLKGEIILKK